MLACNFIHQSCRASFLKLALTLIQSPLVLLLLLLLLSILSKGIFWLLTIVRPISVLTLPAVGTGMGIVTGVSIWLANKSSKTRCPGLSKKRLIRIRWYNTGRKVTLSKHKGIRLQYIVGMEERGWRNKMNVGGYQGGRRSKIEEERWNVPMSSRTAKIRQDEKRRGASVVASPVIFHVKRGGRAIVVLTPTSCLPE